MLYITAFLNRVLLLVVLLLLVSMSVLKPPENVARASSFSNGEPADIADGDVAGLIEAINLANGDPDPSIINLASDGFYTLTSADNETGGPNGLPSITSEVTINGNGSTIERSSDEATPKFRILHVGADGILTLNDATVQNGDISGLFVGGGAIFNSGSLILNESNVLDSIAAAGGGVFDVSGTMEITGSTISGNRTTESGTGGGIGEFGGMFTLTNSVVEGNIADLRGGGIWIGRASSGNVINSVIDNNKAEGSSGARGGGVYNFGTLEITDSTVSNNTAIFGGGVQNSDNASEGRLIVTRSLFSGNEAQFVGGVANSSGRVTVINSTFSGNMSTEGTGGGIMLGSLPSDGSWIDIFSSTFTDNTSAIGGSIAVNGGVITLKNTLSANNIGNDCAIHSGSIVSAMHNLNSDGSCNLNNDSDLPNTAPMLGALLDNGGATLTHAVLPGSPAIDHVPVDECDDADANPLSTDQRGIERPVDGNVDGIDECDIGAYETQLSELPCGDQNGDGVVDVEDAAIDLRIIVGLIAASNGQLILSDIVRDGEINLFDVIVSLKRIVSQQEITECGPA